MTDIPLTQLKLYLKKITRITCLELELLLCCARTQVDQTTEEHIKELLQQGIDWTYLIQISAHHGIIPLLYQNLSTTYPELVPQPILSQMKDYCQSNIQHNLLLTQELFKLLTLFQKHKIPAIPFKGPVLAVSVYGNLALRPFCDLDILIDEQIGRAHV